MVTATELMETLKRIERTARRHPRAAIALFRKLEAAASQAGRHDIRLDALYQRYFTLERLGEATGVMDDLYAGLQVAEDNGLSTQAGRMLEAIGRVRYMQGEYREAMHLWGRCIDMFKVTGDIHSAIEARIGIGAMYNAMGDHVTGARFHRDARELLDGHDDPYLAAKLGLNLGVNQRAMGQRDSAVAEIEAALEQARRGDVREYVAESSWHLGQCARDAGDLLRAESLTREALQLASACRYIWLSSAARISLAQILRQQGRREDARAAYEDALAAAMRVGSRPQQTACCSELSQLAEERGDNASALRYARLYMALELEIKAELSAPDRLRNMQQYDLSEKPPIQKLLELSSSVTMQRLALDDALHRVVTAAGDILRVELVAICLRDEESGRILCRALHGPQTLRFRPGDALDAERMTTYDSLQRTLEEPLVVHDLRLHPAAAELTPVLGPGDVRSLIEVPLRLRGDNVGVATFGQAGARRNWTRDDVLFASHIANLVEHLLSDAQHLDIQQQLEQSNRDLELRVAERTAELRTALRALEDSSLTDPLTGLRNRRFLLQHLEEDAALNERRAREPSSANAEASDTVMFMVDLDHFKHVNDTYGHLAGDAVLIQIKERLLRVFRESDYLVRWGGEEFLIVARATLRSQSARLAERVRATIANEDFVLPDGTRLAKTCSIGYASHPFLAHDPLALSWQEVVGMIDMALYAAKRAGRNAWVGFGSTEATEASQVLEKMKASPRDAVMSGVVVLETNLDRARVINVL
jgi:diguanylate cyclase (GGDEF)-like protein